VRHVGRMYGHIRDLPVVNQPFASPGFYNGFIYTPGFLSPPLWYLKLPEKLRGLLETALDGQTLLQIVATLATLLLYGVVLLLLLRRLLHTYRYWQGDAERAVSSLRPWYQTNVSWYRALLVFPLLPLTRLSEVFIDDYLNFTGIPLLVVTYLLFICYFIAAGCFFSISLRLSAALCPRGWFSGAVAAPSCSCGGSAIW